MRKIYIKWKDIDKATDNLAKQIIKSKLEISAIYGCPRGGLIPANFISQWYDIPIYAINKDEDIRLEFSKYSNVLIIDDINDTALSELAPLLK